MRCALGVDGGASKTAALVVEETGRVLGLGHAGTGNHQVSGLEPSLQEIDRAVRGALEQAHKQPGDIEVGCFCLAGADLPEDYAMLRSAVNDLALAQSIIIKNDTMAALRSGVTDTWGVVVVCGAGFNAAAISPDGREIILPGLGAISGDWGGGFALAQEMIRLAMRAWDGRGMPTLLSGMVLQALGSPSHEHLISRLYHQEIDYHILLGLVPLLFEASQAGDEVARNLVVQLGAEVGVTAKALIRRLSLENEDVEVVLAGSVFKGKGSLLYDTVTCVVREEAANARIIRPQYEPVVGAALLAVEAMDVSVNDAFTSRLKDTLPDRLRLEDRYI
jgi:N-acetylglucosamine kinase-like BadF-type ATPase